MQRLASIVLILSSWLWMVGCRAIDFENEEEFGFHLGYIEAARGPHRELLTARASAVRWFPDIRNLDSELGLGSSLSTYTGGDLPAHPVLLEIESVILDHSPVATPRIVLALVTYPHVGYERDHPFPEDLAAGFLVEGHQGIVVLNRIEDNDRLPEIYRPLFPFGDVLLTVGYRGEYPVLPDLTWEHHPEGLNNWNAVRWWPIRHRLGGDCVVITARDCMRYGKFVELFLTDS